VILLLQIEAKPQHGHYFCFWF